jgi:hypothetical protein
LEGGSLTYVTVFSQHLPNILRETYVSRSKSFCEINCRIAVTIWNVDCVTPRYKFWNLKFQSRLGLTAVKENIKLVDEK